MDPGLKPIFNLVSTNFLPHDIAFGSDPIQIPIAPGIPLCLESVSFRNDKNVFLHYEDYQSIVRCGKKRDNLNPNRNYDNLILVREGEMEKVDW